MNRLIEFLAARVWAMEPNTFEKMWSIVRRHSTGEKLDAAAIAAVTGEHRSGPEDRRDPNRQIINGVGIVPITGVIARHAAQVNSISGPAGTSVQGIRQALRAAVADDQVQSILLDIDSPGGVVDGVTELADEIYDIDLNHKPVFALADGMAASAAYWLASQARQVFTTRASRVGSVGVYAVVEDSSEQAKAAGVDVKVIQFGEHKGALVPGTPIDKQTMSLLQDEVNTYGEIFVEAVARGRGISSKDARALADGLTHVGSAAQKNGMADGVKTFEQVIDEITSGSSNGTGTTSRAANAQVHRENDMSEKASQDKPDAAATTVGPDVSKMTSQELKEANPALYESVASEAAVLERNRVSAIRGLAVKGQEDLVERLIAQGADENTARTSLHEDMRTGALADRRKVEERREAMKPGGVEPNEGLVEKTVVIDAADPDDPEDKLLAECAREWKAMPFSERRFHNNKPEHHVAWKRARLEGHIKFAGSTANGRN